MTTALYTHASSAEHDTGAGHPERIARIEAVNAALAGESWSALLRKEAPLATVPARTGTQPASGMPSARMAVSHSEAPTASGARL